MSFKEISAKELNENPFSLIGDKWMLVTAGNENKFNTMTASWGSMGVMWNKNVVFSFIRPQRYTYSFLDENEYFTLSFYTDEYKSSLAICGKLSGRDVNKVEEAKLTPVFDQKAPYFEQARLVLVCKKLYKQAMKPEHFIDSELESFYPQKDYHHMFIGEIVKVLIK